MGRAEQPVTIAQEDADRVLGLVQDSRVQVAVLVEVTDDDEALIAVGVLGGG